jgi:hypothetical protein
VPVLGNMKIWIITFFLTAGSLFPLIAPGLARVQAQPVEPPLVTIITNAPAAPPFVIKPVSIAAELEKLAQARTDPAVIRAFIQIWATPYSVSVDEVVHLLDLGVPSDVLRLLVQHEAELRAPAPASNNPGVAAFPNPPVPGSGYAPPVAQPSSPAPAVPDQYPPEPDYPSYDGVITDPGSRVYDGSYGYEIVIGDGILVGGHHDSHREHGEHGGSHGWHGCDSGGHAGWSGGHGSGSGEHGGGAHGSGSGGHSGDSGGHGDGGHR